MISDLELANMKIAARALSDADGALDSAVTSASTGRYLLASRALERMVTAGALLSLITEVERCRQRSQQRAVAAAFEEDGA
jgi:hypothetical protein